MRKAVYIVSAMLVGTLLSVSSCKRSYRCNCTFNNQVRLTRDLGIQSEAKAQEICSQYDTTVIGEVWNCTIY
ncbi:hypothetical protein [Nemorincola caseinilytica]|uniref:hypothetical protein n=1 Tax=Nemorincola caseinilytica TaxID=2054315 RepID=UPI0031F0037E